MSRMRLFLSKKMLPNSSLFDVRILDLRALSFCWNLYILVPPVISISCHHWWTSPLNSLFSNQNCSKLKGLGRKVILESQLWQIGQWSELAAGRKFVHISLEPLMISSDTRNFSSLEETRWSPPLLLFHVNQPSPVSRYTRELWAIISLNSSSYLSSTILPPFFSLREDIKLKYPPTIHLPYFSKESTHWRWWIKSSFWGRCLGHIYWQSSQFFQPP